MTAKRRNTDPKLPNKTGKGKLFVTLFVAMSILTSGVAGLLFRYKDLPKGDTITKFEPSRVTQVGYEGYNKKLVNIYDGCYMQDLSKETLPENLKKVAYLSEDKDFKYHVGVNPSSIARAIIANAKAGDVVEGASTIDIQTAQEILKNTYPGYDRLGTLDKKMIEMLFSIKLNVNYMSKEQILYTYLQLVPLYRNLCGVSSVSEQMLGKKVEDLTLNEMIVIISALPGPYYYDPIDNPDKALTQRNITVDKILANTSKKQSMTETEAEELQKFQQEVAAVRNMPLPKFSKPTYQAVGTSSWVSQTIKTELSQTKLPSTLYGKGYQIETTFDPRMQKAVDDRMREWNDSGQFGSDYEVSMIAVDSHDFTIKAILGGKDEFSPTNQFNLATDARAQTGSMAKIAVYATDLQRRLDRCKEGKECEGLNSIFITRPTWPLEGPTGSSMTIKEALSMSINTAAAASLRHAGDGNIPGGQRLIDTYTKFGVEIESDPNKYGYVDPEDPTISLGTNDLSLLELSTVPASLMNGGSYPMRTALYKTPFTTIDKIRDKDGNIIYDQSQTERGIAFDNKVAKVIRAAMKDGAMNGTGKAADVKGLDVITKTGTTNNSQTIGLTAGFVSHGRQYTIIMRMKRKDNRPIGGYGGTVVAPLVRELIVAMDESLDK